MRILKPSVILLLLVLQGCYDDYDFDFDTIITDIPKNLHGLNSEYDDYNSDLDFSMVGATIFYSSRQPSKGGNFDIRCEGIEITYHPSMNRVINISYGKEHFKSDLENSVARLVNTGYNEYGPYTSIEDFYGYQPPFFFYANDESGNLDIKFINAEIISEYSTYVRSEATALNTTSDDAYPCLMNNEIYFCSNRDNNQFDIYSASFTSFDMLKDFLTGSAAAVTKSSALSGGYNDKCPYIFENTMVFTSDRPGGYGGYDLYYSNFKNGSWSAPVNFGPKINSEYDEYRPIIFKNWFLPAKLMIFSSDRPGGMGGFDLYCVRV